MNNELIKISNVEGGMDKIDKNGEELKNAIRKLPIGTLDKIDLDHNITGKIKDLNIFLDNLIGNKINNQELTKEEEEKIDNIIKELGNKVNNLINNMILSMKGTFPEEDFLDLKNKGTTELSNVLDGIKFYEKKNINDLKSSENYLTASEKILENGNTGGFSNAYNKYGSIGGMLASAFK